MLARWPPRIAPMPAIANFPAALYGAFLGGYRADAPGKTPTLT